MFRTLYLKMNVFCADPMETMKCIRKHSVNESLADQCLNAHNYYRCLHGATQLTYDVRLEKTAERYAKKLAQNGVLQPSAVAKRSVNNYLPKRGLCKYDLLNTRRTNSIELRSKFLVSTFRECNWFP